jgi:hypothetical protein
VRYDNLIRWRSWRWWSKALSKQILAITTPLLCWLSSVTHEWPRHKGLSLQVQLRTQARTWFIIKTVLITRWGLKNRLTTTLFADRYDLSKTQTLMWWRLLIKYRLGACTTPRGTPNGLQHDTRPNNPTGDVAAPKQNLNADLFWRFPFDSRWILGEFHLGSKAYFLSFPSI